MVDACGREKDREFQHAALKSLPLVCGPRLSVGDETESNQRREWTLAGHLSPSVMVQAEAWSQYKLGNSIFFFLN